MTCPPRRKPRRCPRNCPRPTVLISGYDDDDPAWGFITRNGCDTRNRLLQRDAVSPSQWTGAISLLPSDGTCPVTQGSWQTPYDIPETPSIS
jgi:hypothetical protein